METVPSFGGIIAIMDTHGVVVDYGHDPTVGHAFRSLNGCRWGRDAMKSDVWELFPSFEVAHEAGVAPCNVCFHGEKQNPR